VIIIGTNYYHYENPQDLELISPLIHIGKRSAAGLYCYDCGIYITHSHTQDTHRSGDRGNR